MNRIEHLLWILGEECAEVTQRASKAARFGLSEIQRGQPSNNAERIMQELYDVIGVIELLQEAGVLTPFTQRTLINAKKEKIEKYLLYSQEQGTLEGS